MMLTAVVVVTRIPENACEGRPGRVVSAPCLPSLCVCTAPAMSSVQHQCTMYGTNVLCTAPMSYVWHQCPQYGTNVLRTAPMPSGQRPIYPAFLVAHFIYLFSDLRSPSTYPHFWKSTGNAAVTKRDIGRQGALYVSIVTT